MKRIRLAKTATWTLIAFSITAGITFFVTGSFLKAGLVALVCRALKIPAFYYHDVMWDKIKNKVNKVVEESTCSESK